MKTIKKGSIEFKAGSWPLSPEKQTVIFIHGASLSKSFWDLQLEELKGEFNTIAIDLPGHGGSDLPSGDSIKKFSVDVLEFIKSLEINTPIIPCGMSMGGAVVQQLAIDHQDMFNACILINTGARLKVLPMIFDMVNSDYNGYIKNTAAFSISSKSDLEKIKKISEKFTGQCSAETTINDFNACNGFDVMDKINAISIPVLVISATEDLSTPLKYGKWLYENIKGAEFVQVEDAGHFSPIEKHEQINKAISDFLNKL